ncbi:MAG: putative O-glycosylation ligase, exosortase A system-associated [Rhizomicrobium sp.]
MRSLFFLALFAAIAGLAFVSPVAGVLGWTWMSLLTPNRLVWGFATTLPLNEILAVITILAWLVSREPKRLPFDLITGLWIGFVVVITISTLSALNPTLAWDRWDKTVKIMALGFMVAILMGERKRLHALTWVIALSLGYFSVRGGLTTILSAGRSHVVGPPGTSINDNNYLALAMGMTIPLMYYLFLHSANRITRAGLIMAMSLSVVGVLGTYSRGGFVGLLFMSLFLWWRSRHRILIAALALALVIPVVSFMPASWADRMESVKHASQQQTFLTRLDSWKVAYRLSKDYPWFGGGFGATEDPDIYKNYSAGESPFAGKRDRPEMFAARRKYNLTPKEMLEMFPLDYTGGHAVHSVYLQVLADHGYIGLAIYLLLLVAFWLRLSRIRRSTRGMEDQKWAHDLTSMLQISMLTFFTSGLAVSMSYYDLPYIFLGMTIALEQYLKALKAGNVMAAENKPAGYPTAMGNLTPPVAR